ncbi:MAG TPA: homocysteine S-methyltransferase family protein [Anaerolineae bacterium]|mgnify:CR=1 FL=1|nr:homocysteine S-methyltransferase family protein [Anaerolineae bacterium]HQK13985.1 homocysteine S-methyltransferase family protein [Anaerolineae bacterium]
MSKFTTLLNQKPVLVADGATGTMLQKAGLKPGAAPERWNLENAAAVRALYKAYIDAGADMILTNTFGGTPVRLERDGLREQVHAVNLAAARLAREVAGEQTLVIGDIGPTGQMLEPLGPLARSEAVAGFAAQAAALVEGGVDAILIETMSDLNEMTAAIEGVRQVTDLPILATMSFDTKGRTMMGVKPERAAQTLWGLGVAVIGANCGRTLTETLEAVLKMRATVPEAVLMAKPNAGLPHAEGGDLVYDVTPEIMAEYAQRFVNEAGVKIFGGCCGSTPEHIRAVAAVLKPC